MFIKVNGKVINSVSVRAINVEPVSFDPWTWRIWAHLTSGDRAGLGTFQTRAEAVNVIDGAIFPKIQGDESVDLDEYYEVHDVSAMERVELRMNKSERDKWFEQHFGGVAN